MIDRSSVLGITLARGGSKSIPLKNMAMINGKPLIQYTIEEALKSKYIDTYVVSTDCDEIAEFALQYKNVIVVRRSTVSDTQTSRDGLLETIGLLADKIGENAAWHSIVAELMCTNPLKTVKDIDKCIELGRYGQSCVAVSEFTYEHPARIKYIEDGQLKDFYPEVPESRRQDLKPKAYVRNGSVYVMPYSNLLKGTRLTHPIAPYIMPWERTVNIDEPRDLEHVKKLMEV